MLQAWLERQWWQPRVTLASTLLRPLSLLYQGLFWLDKTSAKPSKLPVPVVVVGNLVVGGAGKTPATIALVGALKARGFRPGVVSRGYGRDMQNKAERTTPIEISTDESNARLTGDEPLLIARRAQCPVFVGRERVAAARALLTAHPRVDVIVADDGLQHHALAHDAALIVIDERGFGNGLTLPAGPLRQPLPDALPRSSCVIYNAERASTRWPGDVAQRRIGSIQRLDDWRTSARATPLAETIAHLRAEGPVTMAAGIAVPQRFFAMVKQCGLVATARPLPDHDPWTQVDVAGDGPILVTEKDAVKILPRHPLASRMWVATLDFQLPESTVNTLVGLIGQHVPHDH
jgi:tetraacyldisaccharide 4'-kinase